MNLTCPYCGADCGYPDDFYEHECPACGKTFMFDVKCQTVFTERKVPCLNGEPHLSGVTNPLFRCVHCHKIIWREATK